MDPELKEYLDEQFKKSEITTAIITAGFTFISIGFAFLLVGVTMFPSGFWLTYEGYGIVFVFFGYMLYVNSSKIAERDLRKRKKN